MQFRVLSTSFQYPLEVDNQMLNIYQSGEKFELLINNQPFEHLYQDGEIYIIYLAYFYQVEDMTIMT